MGLSPTFYSYPVTILHYLLVKGGYTEIHNDFEHWSTSKTTTTRYSLHLVAKHRFTKLLRHSSYIVPILRCCQVAKSRQLLKLYNVICR